VAQSKALSRRHVLLVEPDAKLSTTLQRTICEAGVSRHAEFKSARRDLESRPFDFIVTNLRLGTHNGLHLVYLAAVSAFSTRSIVYTDRYDEWLGREVRRARAFYETREYLPCSLATYLTATLPWSDRRTTGVRNRRSACRPGRRCSDRYRFLGDPAD
jgi:hypothetical protein